MPSKKPANPFYVLLVLVGIVFTVTASAYGVMVYRDMNATPASAEADAGHPLWKLLDEHGVWILVAELAVLAAATFLAMGTDDYWMSRGSAPKGQPEKSDGKAPDAG